MIWEGLLAGLGSIVVGLVGWWWATRKERKKEEELLDAKITPIENARKAEKHKADSRDPAARRDRAERLRRIARKQGVTILPRDS